MLIVSNKYKRAVYSPARKTTARVTFEMLDTASFNDNTKEVTGEAVISKAHQLTNKIRDMDYKFAVSEKDYLKLDGTHILPTISNDYEVGWWSEAISNEDGVFEIPQQVEFLFGETHSSMGLTMYFDTLVDDYATDITIEVFDVDDNHIAHDQIDNDSSNLVYVKQLDSYKRILLTFNAYSKPYRRLKLTEVDFGVIHIYTGRELINMNVVQEMDMTALTLPADELRFTIDNSKREFNLLNPKGFYGSLQQGQECVPEIGVEVAPGNFEYLQVGKYYLKSWESGNLLSAKFTARDLIDSLTDNTENLEPRDITLYDLAEEVMIRNDIEDYNLSSNLALITTRGQYFKTDDRGLLRMIAQAGRSVAFTDNLGTLHMKQLRSIKSTIEDVEVTTQATIGEKRQLMNNIIEPSFKIASFEKNRFKLDGSFLVPVVDMRPYEIGWWGNVISDQDGYFTPTETVVVYASKDHISINLELVFDDGYAEQVRFRAYDVDNNEVINDTVVNTSQRYVYSNNQLENSRRIEIDILRWSQGNRRARIVEVSFDLPVDKIRFASMHDEPEIQLLESVKFIEVAYYPDNMEDRELYTLDNTKLKSGETVSIDNHLINSLQDAQKVARWLMDEHTKRIDYRIPWRQNPALELGDKVGIENRFMDNTIAYIAEQDIYFSGALEGTTRARGGI